MNPFDIAVVLVASVLMLTGLRKGLVRILIGLVALVAAFVLASQLHRPVATEIGRLGWVSLPDPILMLIAYVLIFLGVMLAGGVLAFLTRTLLRVAMLGWADRLGGAALGLVTATLLAALVVVPMVAYVPAGSAVLERSVLAPYVAVVADVAASMVPDGLSDLYRDGVESLRRLWRDGLLEDRGVA